MSYETEGRRKESGDPLKVVSRYHEGLDYLTVQLCFTGGKKRNRERLGEAWYCCPFLFSYLDMEQRKDSNMHKKHTHSYQNNFISPH